MRLVAKTPTLVMLPTLMTKSKKDALVVCTSKELFLSSSRLAPFSPPFSISLPLWTDSQSSLLLPDNIHHTVVRRTFPKGKWREKLFSKFLSGDSPFWTDIISKSNSYLNEKKKKTFSPFLKPKLIATLNKDGWGGKQAPLKRTKLQDQTTIFMSESRRSDTKN